MFKPQATLFVTCAIVLAACQKADTPAITGFSEAQTVDYFSKHPEVAKTVANKCLSFERQELSKLSSSDQKVWQDSTDGINCRNSKEAASWIYLSERQRQLRESDRQLFGDGKK